MNRRVPINLLQKGVQIFIQSEKMDQEVLFHSLIVQNVPLLPEREKVIGGLNKVGSHDLGISEKLAALQSVLERER
jgi:hypothetical protein